MCAYLAKKETDSTGSCSNQDPITLFDFIALLDKVRHGQSGSRCRNTKFRLDPLGDWGNLPPGSYDVFRKGVVDGRHDGLAELKGGKGGGRGVGFRQGDQGSDDILAWGEGKGHLV
jgi:hypothetical protein